MAHGTPDYGITAGRVTTHQLTDLGELAARLGSPITFDRRGDVIFWDDFECGAGKWVLGSSGAGGAAALSTERARSGESSIKLTAGSDVNEQASMQHVAAFPVLSPLGMEASFNFASVCEWIEFAFSVVYADRVIFPFIRYNHQAGTLQYRDSSGAQVTIATVGTADTTATLFNTMKVVVDTQEEEFVRVLFNENAYDLSGIACQSSASAAWRKALVEIQLEGHTGDNDIAYVDDVIFTQNEPL